MQSSLKVHHYTAGDPSVTSSLTNQSELKAASVKCDPKIGVTHADTDTDI